MAALDRINVIRSRLASNNEVGLMSARHMNKLEDEGNESDVGDVEILTGCVIAGHVNGEQVYTPGDPCRDNEPCSGPDPGDCESGLCVITKYTRTTTAPSTTTTTTPPSSTSTTTMTESSPSTTTSTEMPSTTTTITTTTRRRSTDCPSRAFNDDV
ncbi:hypothetical protein KIN20_027612 [Parelaphostrongylus tenuis]|uniref:Uncharacterized protein n=1 Tax=Parelaphostrongylus tenuis TaxID=148309 RepID=A0AAD5QZK3_PARTN|nr:hypothetical protein KIN20_027612 [Parelaphostrongylus tenuis]